ncbi:VanZ family protein [Flavobacterium sp.]|uniref:VanZ family protein n=1 Tax=Flavobacterium sp. TaxID=239 RepID=UPI0037C0EF8D
MLKKTLFGLAISWTLLIAFLCLVTFSKLPSLGVSGVDKYVHATLHFVFTLFWGSYISLKQNEIKIPKILRVVMLSILYGIVIEILQETTTTTRNADILDVLANFTGTLSALAVFILLKKKKQTNFRY